MGSFAALLIATPLFGFSLTPPAINPGMNVGLHASPATSASAQLAPPNFAALATPSNLTLGIESGTPEEADDDGAGDMRAYAAAIRQRSEIAGIHRPLGIATWAAMGVTLLLGGFQYHNLYGTFSSLEDTPCVTGDAIFGQGQCSGTPYLHLLSGIVTTGLYTATFITSLLMPDPDDAASGDSDYAENLGLHKLLRWVHFGGMVLQLALGAVIANGEAFGLDRANDYGTLQALSTVHLAAGLVTFGAMTWAGALFVL